MKPIPPPMAKIRTVAPLGLALLAFSSLGWSGGAEGVLPPEPSRLRLAFSAGLLGDLNRNDAKASIIAWGRAFLGQSTFFADVQASVLEGTEEMFRIVQRGEVDGVGVMTAEFLSRPEALQPDSVYLTLKNGKTTEQYVLLVHQGSGIRDLAGLKGKRLELQKSARTSPAAAWLDLCLADQGLGLAETVFHRIDCMEKVSRIVLRVFFHQVDACVVTRQAFEGMGELNPQLHKELRVLATSPELVPSLFFFRPGFTGDLRDHVESALAVSGETVAGRQTLALFHGDKVARYPLAALQSTCDLLTAHKRLRKDANP